MVWLFTFSAAFVVQITYWLLLRRGFERAHRLDASGADASTPPISIIVAARDEAARLPALLTALTGQTHPQYEIILVDDASADASVAVVEAWQRVHPNLRLVRVSEPQAPRKKHALTQGIAAACYDLLAFTDADCTPPPGWASALARAHSRAAAGASRAGETVLVGYSPFRKGAGWVNRLARYETFVTGFLTAAMVGLGRPYMAVGRNLSYSRALFRRLGGFGHSLHAMSGDDDLLVQEVARREAAAIRHIFEPSSFVPSDPPATGGAWLRQKLRHLSAGRSYAARIQMHLALFHATNVLLWGAPLMLGWPGFGLLAVKLTGQFLVLRHAAAVFHERDLLTAQPLLELAYAAYNLCIAPLGLVRTPRRW